ncbi:MAG TPA: type II secretion system F family protein [Candidatus Polarisedimenticolaceae bacterium]
MPEFVCRMALPTGEIVERVLESADEASLRRELEEKDYLLLALRRRNALFAGLVSTFSMKPKVSPQEFLFFNQEFSALLRAGLPILASLDILIERRKNPVFRKALVDVRERVKSGEALSQAFQAQGELFPRLYWSSLASGERSGELPSVLARYIAYTRSVLAVRKKLISAATYPAILLTLALVLVGVMVFYVIPQFSSFLKELNVDLPMVTVWIMEGANYAVANWWMIVGVAVVAAGTTVTWIRSESGRLAFDRIKFRIPLIGRVIHDYAQNRFTRTLGTLVAGGIPLVTALELAARAVGNSYMEERLQGVTQSVREGQALWESLERTKLVSDISIEMIKVGESTGALVEMLDYASSFTEEEIDFRLNRLITFVEPIMLVFMAAVVAGMLMAVYLPLLQAAGGGAKF